MDKEVNTIVGDSDSDNASYTLSDQQWQDIQERLRWLSALEAAGVDNWEGMDNAADIYRTFK